MADGDNGFTAPNSGNTSTETKAGDAALPTAGAVRSNHNSLHEVNPVLTANLIGKPDYNPMRMTPNRSNDASDVTLVPESAKALVDSKGDRPTQKEDVLNGRDQAGNEDVKLSGDTIIHDPVTMITTRPGASLAEELAETDRNSRNADATRADAETVDTARM